MGPAWIDETELVVNTNNILTYLDFVLADPYADPIDCRLWPPAPADTYYGATFGRLTSLIELWPPAEPRELAKDAAKALNDMADALEFGDDTLILMTASGLDNSTAGFQGPHVGSYYNMLIKKFLLSKDVPTALVLEDAKVFKSFHKGKCFGVCDGGGPDNWESICKTKPLAIVTCASKENAEQRQADLRDLTFEFQHIEPLPSMPDDVDASGDFFCILAANQQFAERFELDGKINTAPQTNARRT